MGFKYYIDEKWYRIKPEERYIRVNGWGFDTDGADVHYITYLNGKQVESRVKIIKRADVKKKFGKYAVPTYCGYHIKTYVNDSEIIDNYALYISNGEKQKCIFRAGKNAVNRMINDSTISYNIDNIRINDNKVTITGWATSVYGNQTIVIDLTKRDGQKIETRFRKEHRHDLVEEGLVQEESRYCGFVLEFSGDRDEKYTMTVSDGHKTKHLSFDLSAIRRRQKVRSRVGFVREASKHINQHSMMKVMDYVKSKGFSGLGKYIVTEVNKAGKPYKVWFKEHTLSKWELQEQSRVMFEKQPKVSIVVPTYETPINYLREMIDSVRNQTYANWELCIADGSEGDSAVEEELKRYHQMDSRIKYQILKQNLGIAGNTNGALELVTGEYVGLLDHDDILAPNALYEVVRALQEDDYDIVYTDEDKISGDNKEHMDPNFKPDFSIDLFRSHNYITHFFVVKTAIVKSIGGFRNEYNGSQDYDLMFRCIENADKIKHIPMILYHWRVHMNSVAGNPASKMYAYEAGKKAIEDHLKRSGIEATVEHLGLWGMYHVKYAVHGDPMVSIIIPNKDHVKDLKACIDSLYEKSAYQNFEIIVVENNSTEQETFRFYEELKANHGNIRVVYWEKEFNYSAINNFGVEHAKGEYLLFLNNDTELIAPDSISEMLGCCMRDDVGAVGAKLLYEDDTVQHAGVVIGFGNYAGHVNTGIGRNDYGYMVRARVNCNYSAVTAACMMTKKSLFTQVNGFDEQFAVACNDVDYCLKLREINKLIVFNAFSEWYHYESKSRGYEDSEAKIKRFEGEMEMFRDKWQKILEEGDPFYNRNFPITQPPFTLG